MSARKPQSPDHQLTQKLLAGHIICLQHVGHVVSDLDQAIDNFRVLYGLDDSAIRRVPEQGASVMARFAFLTVGDTEFELIEPVSADQKKMLMSETSGGGGINHIAWRVRDLDAALEILASQGVQPGHVTPQGPVSLIDKRLVYLDPATTGGLLVELIELDVVL